MPSDQAKSKQQLIEELTRLRRQAAAADELQHHLAHLEKAYADLQNVLQERKISSGQKRPAGDAADEALRMAEVIIDQTPAVLFRRIAGGDHRLVYVSNNIGQFGYTAQEFLNGDLKFKEIVHPDDVERMQAEIKSYAEKDVEEYTQIYRILTKSGQTRWVEDQTSVVRDSRGQKIFNQGIVVDITPRKLAEEQLRKSEEKYRRIVETAGEGFILMDEDLKITDVNAAYCHMLGYRREELLGKTPLDLATDEFRQFMVANREKLLAAEYRKFEGTSIAKDGRLVPILVHGNTLRDDKGKIIGNMAFVTDLTEQKKALALAAEVQKSLLPQHKPQIPGLDVAGRNVSCEEIGGDYFDFLWQQEYPGAYFSAVVGDITGHGVDAALLMSTARAFLRMRASQSGTIAQIVTEMNRHLAQDVLDSGRFMTLFYLSLDPAGKQLQWVRAGHDPALLYDPVYDRFEQLKGDGIALGLAENFTYRQYSKTGLAEQQIIAIGTDGIWEARNSNGEMFGKQRLRAIIRNQATAGAGNILNAVYEALNRFTGGAKSEDDITLVVIKVNRGSN